jgi:hypothetical protein
LLQKLPQPPFYVPSGLVIYNAEFNPEKIAVWSDKTGIPSHEGLCYQAAAFASFVSKGITDSPLRPLRQVISDIGLIEKARRQVGALLTGER